jgi:hypothetical protein
MTGNRINRKDALKTVFASIGLSGAAMAQSPAAATSPLPDLGFGLGALPLLDDSETRSISPENPTGGKGQGARAVPNPSDPDLSYSGPAQALGRGWKVRPFVKSKAGQTLTLMDVDGPGVIQHIWMATETNWAGNGRACVLRFYWDGEETPSIEVPMTDFFAVGHDLFAPVNSLAVVVNPTSALNCYWPMPFRRKARVTFSNEGEKDLALLAYQITYAKREVPASAAYLHAQWRRNVTDRRAPEHVLVDGVQGQGRYVGTFIAWTQLSDGWFGEGEIKFFLDGDRDFPTICGTGTEDYFGGSYGFPAPFTGPYAGCTLKRPPQDGPPKWSLYRWHITDPVCFRHDLRVNIQALGWWPNLRYQPLAEDIASVAYWYQREPHAPFPKFPPLTDRWPR